MKNELFERVCEDVKAMLQEEPYRSGGRLPPERALAERFGVNRSTVREAVRALVNLGLLQTRQGSGTTLRSDPGGLFQGAAEALLLLGESPVEDLYEARELVEVYLAGQAALRRTDADLAVIESSLAKMRPLSKDYADHNARFHEAIAKAAQNAILYRFMMSLIGGIEYTVRVTQPAVKNPTVSFGVHAAIAQAIADRDHAAAEEAMREHMRIARGEWDRTKK